MNLYNLIKVLHILATSLAQPAWICYTKVKSDMTEDPESTIQEICYS